MMLVKCQLVYFQRYNRFSDDFFHAFFSRVISSNFYDAKTLCLRINKNWI